MTNSSSNSYFCPKFCRREPRFTEEMRNELNMSGSALHFPDWVYIVRESQIRKLTSNAKKICRYVKSLGYDFKIKWPIVIDGKWKFADIYFPRQRTVLLFANPMGNLRPCGLPSYRAEFFCGNYRVVEVEDVSDVERWIYNETTAEKA